MANAVSAKRSLWQQVCDGKRSMLPLRGLMNPPSGVNKQSHCLLHFALVEFEAELARPPGTVWTDGSSVNTQLSQSSQSSQSSPRKQAPAAGAEATSRPAVTGESGSGPTWAPGNDPSRLDPVFLDPLRDPLLCSPPLTGHCVTRAASAQKQPRAPQRA